MKTIWISLVSGWNLAKIIRVAAGVLILISGISEHNNTAALLGLFLLVSSLVTNGSCCMYGGPAIPDASKMKGNEELDVEK